MEQILSDEQVEKMNQKMQEKAMTITERNTNEMSDALMQFVGDQRLMEELYHRVNSKNKLIEDQNNRIKDYQEQKLDALRKKRDEALARMKSGERVYPVHVEISFTPKQYNQISKAAEVLGISIYDFIEKSALEESDVHAHRHADSGDDCDDGS